MKVCVVGAGAIGGHLAARLAKGGADVSAVARGAQLEAMRRAGLRVVAPDGRSLHADIAVSDDPAELGPQDAVIVAVKAPALPAVAAAIAPLLGPDTAGGVRDERHPVVVFPCAMAGRMTARTCRCSIPAACCGRRSACTAPSAASSIRPAPWSSPASSEVEHRGNRLVLGELDGSPSPRLDALAELLRAGGLTVEISERIRDVVWSKLLLNLGSGPLGVLTASAPKDFYAEAACQRGDPAGGGRSARRWPKRSAAACPATPRGRCATAPSPATRPASCRTSSWAGRWRSTRSTPSRWSMARAHGVATPTLDLLAALTRARARGRPGLYSG